MIPRIQFRFSVPALVVIVALGIAVIAWYARATQQREAIKFGAELVGGAVAIYSLLLSVQAARTASAAKFVERWNDPGFAAYRKAISDALVAKDISHADRQVNLGVLNFWEEIAVAANRGDADETLLEEFFRTAAVRYFEVGRSWIQDQRDSLHWPSGYRQYQALAERWQRRV